MADSARRFDTPARESYNLAVMTDVANPYITDSGRPALRKSVVAFVDMLGYKDMVSEAHERGTSAKLLQELHDALRLAFLHLNGRDDDGNPVLALPLPAKEFYAIRAFTDNVVIGYPVHDDAEFEFGLIFSQLGLFQLELSNKGFFMRGAISFGDLFIDDITVFGDGLVDAFEGESKCARDPRIILTESAQQLVKDHLKYYADPKDSPQAAEVYKDADGRYFLNYLEFTGDGEHYDEPAILGHKSAVVAKLQEFRNRPDVWAKYAWVAGYHNYFCPAFNVEVQQSVRQPLSVFCSRGTSWVGC